MWERAELKQNAKKALSRYYWMAVAVCMLYSIIAGLSSSSGASRSIATAQTILQESSLNTPQLVAVLALLHTFFGAIAVVGILIGFFVVNPLRVGLCRYFMESRMFKSNFSTLFYGFTGGRYWKNVKVLALADVKIILWTCLFIVPGIVKSYEYTMLPFLLAENAQLQTKRYFELSKEMTNGEKAAIFVLHLSFVGWVMLALFTCGIGHIFLTPYMEATSAELYALMRAKAFSYQFSNPGELCDFLPPMA